MKKLVLALTAVLAMSLLVVGCGGNKASTKTIKVGATAVPHAEILEVVKPVLENEGIKLEVIEFNDYVQPNLSLNDKELDANFFQHKPYLDNLLKSIKNVSLQARRGFISSLWGFILIRLKNLTSLKTAVS